MYKLEAATDRAELLLYDDIGAGFFGGISAQQVLEDLKDVDDKTPLDVRINSPGGDVFDGVAIYNALARRTGPVRVFVDALAASIASVIAMAGEPIVMSRGSMMMIHDPWTLTYGSASELRRVAELLDTIKDNIADIYDQQSGAELDDIRQMMLDETWMDAEQAVALGFADDVEANVERVAAAVVPFGRYKNTPSQFKSKEGESPASFWRRESRAARLALLSGKRQGRR